MKISASLGGGFFFLFKCKDVASLCDSPLVSPPARRDPGAAAAMPRTQRQAQDGGSAPQREGWREEATVAALRELWGGWLAGWSKPNRSPP